MAAKKPGRVRVSGGGKGRTIDAEAKKAEAEARRRGAQGRLDRAGAGAGALVAAREKALVAGHHAGRSSEELAKRWGISTRSVNRALAAARERRSALEVPSMDLVKRALGEYESQMELFTVLGVEMLERKADAPAIGAFKAAAEAFERWLLTLAELGVLPEDLRLFRGESDLARLGQLVLDAIDDVAAGKLAPAEARDRVKELVTRRQLPVLESRAVA